MIQKRNIFIAIFIISFLIVGSIVYFLVFKNPEEKAPAVEKEKTMEEILKDLTAPPIGEIPEVSEETIKSLTAPK